MYERKSATIVNEKGRWRNYKDREQYKERESTKIWDTVKGFANFIDLRKVCRYGHRQE
jgi:hypothetical protein